MIIKAPEYNTELVSARLQNELRLDAGFSAFVANQLKEMDSRLFDVKYANLEALNLLPVNGNFNPGAETISYKQYDGRGAAQITSDYATASPSSDIAVAEYFGKITGIRSSITYSIQEMRAAQMAGVSLDMQKMNTARRIISEGIESVALFGSAANNLTGFFSVPNVPSAASSDSWTATSSWTPAEIAQQIIDFVNSVKLTTKGVHRANRLVLPVAVALYLQSLRLGSVNDTTVLQFVRMQLPGVEIIESFQLSDKAIAYEYSPENLELVLPIAFEAFPEKMEPTFIVREMHARCGGVRAFYPLSMAYKTAIQTA